jgi:hypothetical protein
MLSLVSLFLVTLLASASVVWMYRRMPEILDFLDELFSQSDSAVRSTGGLQQFLSSVSTPGSNASNLRGGKARSVILRSFRGEVKVPWGW